MQIDPAKLVEARLARAMSQEEAAIASDLSARTIQRIEAGHPASLESTKALLTVFGSEIIHDPQGASDHSTPSQRLGTLFVEVFRQSLSLGFDGLRLLFVAVFLFAALYKPFAPDKTGLFVADTRFMLGVGTNPPPGATEVLGYWIMPVMLIAAMCLLMTIGRIRRIAQPLR